MAVAEAGSDVGDFNTLIGVHWAACGPGDGLNSGLSWQRAAVALETQPSLHRVAICPQPQRTLQKWKDMRETDAVSFKTLNWKQDIELSGDNALWDVCRI